MSGKISTYPEKTMPATNDYLLGDDTAGGQTSRFKIQNLISTFMNNIASGQGDEASLIQTYTPSIGSTANVSSVTASGKYLNLLGLKICWINVNVAYSANGVHVQNVSFPSGFFSTIDAVWPTIQGEGNFANQLVSGDSIQGTAPNNTFSFYVTNVGGGGSGVISLLAIGE